MLAEISAEKHQVSGWYLKDEVSAEPSGLGLSI